MHHTLPIDCDLIGEFRILDLLGSGGFANTYLAIEHALGRRVAIKEFFPSDLSVRRGPCEVQVKTPGQVDLFRWGLERFVREAKTLAKFRHPNIVRVFRVFEANETAYIVLEFVNGSDLERWLTELGRPPTQAELDVLVPPLLEALQVVHGANILHRDIKPANIYIRESDRKPVLIDFGAARSAISEHTGTTTAIVSRGYSAHESYASDNRLQGPWTDVYGLAATLYRALSGSAPPESTSRVIDDHFVPAATLPGASKSYRPEFLAAVDAGMALMPKERPQSVAEWRREMFPKLAVPASGEHPVGGQSGAPSFGPTSAPAISAPGISASRSGNAVAKPKSQPSISPSEPHSHPVPAVASQSRDSHARSQAHPRALSHATLVLGLMLMVGGACALIAIKTGLLRGGAGNSVAVESAEQEAAEAKRQKQAEEAAAEAKMQKEAVAAAEAARARREQETAEAKRQKDAEEAAAEAKKQKEAVAAAEAARVRRAQEAAEAKRQKEAEEAAAEAKKQREAAAEAELVRREQEAAEARRQKEADEAAAEAKKQKEAAAAAEVERVRLEQQEAEAKRQKDAEEAAAEAERQKEAAAAAEAERVAREKIERQAAIDAKSQVPTETERATYLKQVQTALKGYNCYSGKINGDTGAATSALKRFESQYKGSVRKINLTSATVGDYEDWLTWSKGLEKFSCPSETIRTDTDNDSSSSKKVQRVRPEPRQSKKEARSAPVQERAPRPQPRSGGGGGMTGVGF